MSDSGWYIRTVRKRLRRKGAMQMKRRKKDQDEATINARRLLAERAEAEAEPPTDDLLKIVWDRWHKLPEGLLPEEKRLILLSLGVADARHSLHGDFLTAQAGGVLLTPQFSKSVDRAARWTQLVDYLRSTRKEEEDGGHRELIERHWAWEHPVNSAVGRIAILRAGRELDFTHPGLIEKAAPSLNDISTLEDRYAAYTEARKHGLNWLRPRLEKLIPKGLRLAWEHRAPAVWSSREDVSRALIIAALDALGLCSKSQMTRCRRVDLPLMSENQRRRFDATCRKRADRGNTIFPLKLWLCDNAPLITEFDLRPNDLIEVAREREIVVQAGSAGRAMSDIVRWGLPFRFKRGPRRALAEEIGRNLLELPVHRTPISPKPLLKVQ